MKKITHKPSKKPHEPWQKPPKPAPRTRGDSEQRGEEDRVRRTAGKGAARPASRYSKAGPKPPWTPRPAGAGEQRTPHLKKEAADHPGEDRRGRPGAKGTLRPGLQGSKPGSKAPAPRKPAGVAGAAKAGDAGEAEIFPLNKFLAHTGLCARRKAVEFIKAGTVSVNGRTVREPGFKVTAADDIRHQDKRLRLKIIPVYILLNKPKGCITTTADPRARHTVMDIIAKATTERVYPVGRLDRNTSGLLLLTNDGDLAQLLAHPSNEIVKVYHVALDKALTKNDFDRIATGVTLDDGHAPVDHLAYEDPDDRTQIGIEIHSGRNRIVRRIFEFMGYEVKALDRVLYAGLTKKNLPRGKWRFLTEKEVLNLKHFGKGH